MATRNGVTYKNASQFVSEMVKKYNINKCWVWDILEEEYNIIKGLGCVMNLIEMQEVEYIIKSELDLV